MVGSKKKYKYNWNHGQTLFNAALLKATLRNKLSLSDCSASKLSCISLQHEDTQMMSDIQDATRQESDLISSVI